MRRFVLVAILVGAGLIAPTTTAARAADPCDSSVFAAVNAPVTTSKCTGVRPGQQVASSQGRCTMNFLFAGSDGNRYMGVAGHCVPGADLDTTWAYGSGPVATVNGQRIGEWVYAVNSGVRDFSLVRLDTGVAASGELMHFGGPTALYTDHAPTPALLHHYGQISMTGSLVPGRSMIAPNTLHTAQVAALGAGVWGDSGSAVIDSSGRAVGVLVTLGAINSRSAGTNGITRLDHQLPFAERSLGVQLALVTAPLRKS